VIQRARGQSELPNFAAIVLAGDRTAQDPVAREAGVACKAFAPVAGRPMLLRVLDALEACETVSTVVLCGPPRAALAQCPELQRRIEAGRVRWISNAASPSLSAAVGLETIAADMPVLLTTADHALLDPEIVSFFLRAAWKAQRDASVGLVRHEIVRRAFPDTRRTVMRFSDGEFCTCNLFAFTTRAGRSLVPFWRGVEQRRKRPWRVMAGILGPIATARFLLGMISRDRAMAAAGRRLGLNVGAVDLPFARAGIDVDTPADRRLAETILSAHAEPV
jgi:GTP:adenosylcobinamide-phosphate guanylyltransferase